MMQEQCIAVRRLEKKWMMILIIFHIMLEGTEKFHFFEP